MSFGVPCRPHSEWPPSQGVAPSGASSPSPHSLLWPVLSPLLPLRSTSQACCLCLRAFAHATPVCIPLCSLISAHALCLDHRVLLRQVMCPTPSPLYSTQCGSKDMAVPTLPCLLEDNAHGGRVWSTSSAAHVSVLLLSCSSGGQKLTGPKPKGHRSCPGANLFPVFSSF